MTSPVWNQLNCINVNQILRFLISFLDSCFCSMLFCIILCFILGSNSTSRSLRIVRITVETIHFQGLFTVWILGLIAVLLCTVVTMTGLTRWFTSHYISFVSLSRTVHCNEYCIVGVCSFSSVCLYTNWSAFIIDDSSSKRTAHHCSSLSLRSCDWIDCVFDTSLSLSLIDFEIETLCWMGWYKT